MHDSDSHTVVVLLCVVARHMDADITRWRIAYDTVSALIAVDQSGARRWQQAQQPSRGSAAGAGPTCSVVSSHRDSADMIQQQQQRGGVAGVQLTQSSLSTVSQNVQSNHRQPPTISSVEQSNHVQRAVPMRSLGAGCGVDDDVMRMTRDGEALVALFRRLLDTFYMETMLWMYNSVLLQPAARRTRNRLHWLGIVTGRSLEQATSNVLTGFVAGYRHSRRAVNSDIEQTLMTMTASDQAGRLAQLAVELAIILNVRLMMRSFSAVVRDLVFRTSSQPLLAAAPAPASRLYRYTASFTSHIYFYASATLSLIHI